MSNYRGVPCACQGHNYELRTDLLFGEGKVRARCGCGWGYAHHDARNVINEVSAHLRTAPCRCQVYYAERRRLALAGPVGKLP